MDATEVTAVLLPTLTAIATSAAGHAVDSTGQAVAEAGAAWGGRLLRLFRARRADGVPDEAALPDSATVNEVEQVRAAVLAALLSDGTLLKEFAALAAPGGRNVQITVHKGAAFGGDSYGPITIS